MELVLIILRRLAEDIRTFESGLDQRRRKEMTAALNEHADSGGVWFHSEEP